MSRRESRLRTLEEIHRNPAAAAAARHAQRRNDSDVSSELPYDDDNDDVTGSMDAQLRQYNDQIPLLDSLQRELGSAQDTINALTNQNSELRAQMLRHHQTGGGGGSTTSNGIDTGEVFIVASCHSMLIHKPIVSKTADIALTSC